MTYWPDLTMNPNELLDYHYFMMEEFYIRSDISTLYSETRIPCERNTKLSDNYEVFDLISEMYRDAEGYYD